MAVSDAASPLVRCRSCGADATRATRFCTECGQAFGSASNAQERVAANDEHADALGTSGQAEQAAPDHTMGALPTGAAPQQVPANIDLRQRRYVLAGKIAALVAGQGFALAVMLRSIAGGALQTILLQLAHFVAAKVSAQALGLLGFLGAPLQSDADQLVQQVGYPPLPSLWLFATLGMLVIAALPACLVLAGEPPVRWRLLWTRMLRRIGPAPDTGEETLLHWFALADVCVDHSARWLLRVAPYASGALVLALPGAIPATLGLLCWLAAGALELGDQVVAGRGRTRAALPAAYGITVLVGLALALQGLRAWGA